MSVPEISCKVGGYEFMWQQEMVKIIVTHIKSHSDGRVIGELKIIRIINGKNTHLHQAQFNFIASRSRTELAKILSSRDDQVDWYSILEQVAVMTLDKERSGEPLIHLYSGENVKPPEFLLHPLIIKNYPTVFFGDPGSAKSTTAIILSQLMMLPWSDNPLGFEAPENPIKWLYLDWETDESTIQWQLTCLDRGMHKEGLYLPYRRCALPLSMDLDQIRKYIDESDAQGIIIDSLGLACGGELKESGPAIAFFGALRQLHTTSIILAHTAKGGDNTANGNGKPTRSIYGSVYFEAQSRSVWEVVKDIDGQGLNLTLNHRKAPPFQKKHDPLAFRLEYDDNGYLQIGLGEVKETPDGYLAKLGTQHKIMDVLKTGIKTVPEICKVVNLDENNVRNALSELKKNAKVNNIKRGLWGLSEQRFLDNDFNQNNNRNI
jgi:hypothetical protein